MLERSNTPEGPPRKADSLAGAETTTTRQGPRIDCAPVIRHCTLLILRECPSWPLYRKSIIDVPRDRSMYLTRVFVVTCFDHMHAARSLVRSLRQNKTKNNCVPKFETTSTVNTCSS